MLSWIELLEASIQWGVRPHARQDAVDAVRAAGEVGNLWWVHECAAPELLVTIDGRILWESPWVFKSRYIRDFDDDEGGWWIDGDEEDAADDTEEADGALEGVMVEEDPEVVEQRDRRILAEEKERWSTCPYEELRAKAAAATTIDELPRFEEFQCRMRATDEEADAKLPPLDGSPEEHARREQVRRAMIVRYEAATRVDSFVLVADADGAERLYEDTEITRAFLTDSEKAARLRLGGFELPMFVLDEAGWKRAPHDAQVRHISVRRVRMPESEFERRARVRLAEVTKAKGAGHTGRWHQEPGEKEQLLNKKGEVLWTSDWVSDDDWLEAMDRVKKMFAPKPDLRAL